MKPDDVFAPLEDRLEKMGPIWITLSKRVNKEVSTLESFDRQLEKGHPKAIVRGFQRGVAGSIVELVQLIGALGTTVRFGEFFTYALHIEKHELLRRTMVRLMCAEVAKYVLEFWECEHVLILLQSAHAYPTHMPPGLESIEQSAFGQLSQYLEHWLLQKLGLTLKS